MALYIITEDNSNKNGRKQKVRDSDVSQESLALSNPNKMYTLQNPSLSKPIIELRIFKKKKKIPSGTKLQKMARFSEVKRDLYLLSFLV